MNDDNGGGTGIPKPVAWQRGAILPDVLYPSHPRGTHICVHVCTPPVVLSTVALINYTCLTYIVHSQIL